MGVFAKIKDGFVAKFPEDFSHKEGRKNVMYIAMPTFAEVFMLQLSGMVNMMMVGSLGPWAIAAIGYCNQPRMLIAFLFQAFNTGSTALVARAKGAKNASEANAVMHQAISFSMSLSVLMAFLGYTFATPMVVFMGAYEEATITGATQYFQIIMLTFPAHAFTLAITAMLRGIGQARISMIYNITANVINVCVGFLFIQGRFGLPALGVQGAALGLGTGQVVAMIMAIITMARGADILKLSAKQLFRIDLTMLRRVARIGSPAMFEQFCLRGGNIMFVRIVASLGTAAFATHMIVMNIHQMTLMNGQSFGVSASSLLGQSLGRKRPDQGKAIVTLCRRYALFIALGTAFCVVVFGRHLMRLYTDDPTVIAMGAMIFWLVALLQPLQSSQQVVAGALRGAGDTKAVAGAMFVGLVIIRPVVSATLVLGAGLGLVGVWIAMIADQGTRSIFTMWRFINDKWQTIKV